MKGWLAEQNASEVDITKRLLDAERRDALTAQLLEKLADIKSDTATNRECVMQIIAQLDKITARSECERKRRFTRAFTMLGVAFVGQFMYQKIVATFGSAHQKHDCTVFWFLNTVFATVDGLLL